MFEFTTVEALYQHLNTFGPLYTDEGKMVHCTSGLCWYDGNPLYPKNFLNRKLYSSNPVVKEKQPLKGREEKYNNDLEMINQEIKNIIKK